MSNSIRRAPAVRGPSIHELCKRLGYNRTDLSERLLRFRRAQIGDDAFSTCSDAQLLVLTKRFLLAHGSKLWNGQTPVSPVYSNHEAEICKTVLQIYTRQRRNKSDVLVKSRLEITRLSAHGQLQHTDAAIEVSLSPNLCSSTETRPSLARALPREPSSSEPSRTFACRAFQRRNSSLPSSSIMPLESIVLSEPSSSTSGRQRRRKHPSRHLQDNTSTGSTQIDDNTTEADEPSAKRTKTCRTDSNRCRDGLCCNAEIPLPLLRVLLVEDVAGSSREPSGLMEQDASALRQSVLYAVSPGAPSGRGIESRSLQETPLGGELTSPTGYSTKTYTYGGFGGIEGDYQVVGDVLGAILDTLTVKSIQARRDIRQASTDMEKLIAESLALELQQMLESVQLTLKEYGLRSTFMS